jgi:hypothetical protein
MHYRVLVTRLSVGPEFTDALVEHYLAEVPGQAPSS